MASEASARCTGVCSQCELHGQHHFGVDRSLYLSRLVDPNIRREEVERLVRSCWQCCSIDPALVRHTSGQLSIEGNWKRLALDVTYYGQGCYFTVIDCSPSRFAVWRKIRSENAADVSAHLSEIFRERGPPPEVLMDNSTTFRSKQVAELCKELNVCRLDSIEQHIGHLGMELQNKFIILLKVWLQEANLIH